MAYKRRLYPRDDWRSRILIGAGILSFVLACALGIPTAVRGYHVVHSGNVINDTKARNHLVRMIAGADPSDGSVLGRLAGTTQGLLKEPDQIKSLQQYYVWPGTFNGASDLLGFDICPADDSGDHANDGHFTDGYILLALHSSPKFYQNALEPIPSRTGLGLLRWENVVGVLVVLWLLVGLGLAALRVDRQLWPKRELRKYLNSLSPVARSAYDIVGELEALPLSTQRDSILSDARQFLNKCADGYAPQAASDAWIAEMRQRLSYLKADYEVGSEFVRQNQIH